MHTEEVKIRLTEADARLLRALALRRDVPVAVLARALLRRGLESGHVPSIAGQGAARRGA